MQVYKYVQHLLLGDPFLCHATPLEEVVDHSPLSRLPVLPWVLVVVKRTLVRLEDKVLTKKGHLINIGQGCQSGLG